MTNRLRWLAVINPTSGGGRAKKRWHKKIKPKLDLYGVNYTEYFTNAPQDGIERTQKEINNYDGFIAIGGDGTSNEVINGILKGTIDQGLENDKIFAIIPAGTGNDVAHAFDLPYDDYEKSCGLFNPENKVFSRFVDVGKAIGTNMDGNTSTRYFCGVLSSGFDAEVAHKTNKGSKFLPGTATYIKALLTNIIWLNSEEFEVTILGSENHEFVKNGILIAVGLGPYYGGGMKICPEAEVDDGIFHITFLQKVPRRTLLRVFPKVYDGKHVNHPAVDLYTGTGLEINSKKEKLWQVDGEIIGYTPVRVETVPKALKVLCSPSNTSNDNEEL